MRFQTIAPISAEKTTTSPWTPGRRVDDAPADGLRHLGAEERADEVDTAAMSSAARGVSARVDTEVAMALAASWKPLV